MEHQLVEVALRYFPYILGFLATILVAIIFFSVQLWRYGPDIRKLNKFETIAQLAYFAEQQKHMTAAFGEATASSHQMREAASKALADLDNLRDFVTDMQEKMSEYNADAIVQNRLEEEAEEQRQRGVYWSRPKGSHLASDDPDTLYKNMMEEWDKFVGVFRQRLLDANITPVLNRIGKMIYQLTDRRRRSPLPLETAELVTALHSQYKRYTRLQGTRSQWLTREIHDDFVRLVETAIQELNRPVSPIDPESTSRVSNGVQQRLM